MGTSLKLRQKIYFFVTVSTLIFISILAVAYTNFNNLSQNFQSFSETSDFAKNKISLAKDIEKLKSHVQKYIYIGFDDASAETHKLYKQIIFSLDNSTTPPNLTVTENIKAIKTHLEKYYTTFKTLEKQVKARQKLYTEKLQLAKEIEKNLSLYYKQATSAEKLLYYQIKIALYNANENSLLYKNTLEGRYIKLTKKSLKKASTLLLRSLDKNPNNTLLIDLKQQLFTYTKMSIKEIQRTRGYMFLVNVVMATEAYEVLYNANIISDISKSILDKIDHDIDANISDSIEKVTIFGLLFLIITLAISLIFTRSIVTPITKLTKALMELSKGNTKAIIPPYKSDDEIGRLTDAAQSFLTKNIKMAKLLKHSKKLSKNLSLSEERFSLALEGAQDGLWDWNLTTDKVFYSATWKRMFGYEEHEINNDIDALKSKIHPDDFNHVIKDIQDYLEGRTKVYKSEMRMLCKDGTYKYILSRGKAIFDTQGQATRLLGFHIDMSDQKKLEKKLLNAKTEAEKANHAKSDFLANMSHEIRTPLNGILGLTDLVLKSDLTDKQEDYLQKSKTSSLALLRVINDILDYSKIEAGKLDLESRAFDIETMMTNIKNLFDYQAHQKGIKLLFTSTFKEHKLIIGDALRLTQILTNLIGNALKFTHEGSVEVSLTVTDETEHDYKLQFSVKDSGIGMKPEILKGLFKEFSQADTSITREYGGTGLGLAISKKLTLLMGGEIWVQSTENQGSTFSFNGRFTKTDTETSMEPKNSIIEFDPFDLQLLKDTQILAAEDNKTNQLVLRGILQEYGVSLEIANNGQEAVEMAKKKQYDVILMDLQMPVMDGFEATKNIRTLSNYTKTPIFALSAAVMQKDKELTSEAGMDEHLAKPIEYKLFIQTLITYVKAQKALP